MVEDWAVVDAVTSAAFDGAHVAGEPVETDLLRALRRDDAWLPAFSLVAVLDDRVVGHVVCTRGHVDAAPALGLGPISVLPPVQGRGVGTALMHTIIGAADAAGEPLIALLGDQRFYGRFGFVPASQVGLQAPDSTWGDHFQARALTGYTPGIAGAFRYAAPFADL